jgi:hypothetical protein
MAYNLEYGKDPKDGKFWRDKPLEWLAENEPDASDARFLLKRFPKLFTEVPYTSYSRQYNVGGPSNESNARVWADMFAPGPEDGPEDRWWWEFGGDTNILVATELAPEEAIEVIANLNDYPILDESDLNELEFEIQTENWNDYGRREVKDELISAADQVDDANGEMVRELLDAISDKAFDNAYYNSMHFAEAPEQDGGGYGTIFHLPAIALEPLEFDNFAVWLGLTTNEAHVMIGDIPIPEPYEFLQVTQNFRLDVLREILAKIKEWTGTPEAALSILEHLWMWREVFEERLPNKPLAPLVLNLVREAEDKLREAIYEIYEDEDQKRLRMRDRLNKSVLGEVETVLTALLGETISAPEERRVIGRFIAEGELEGGWGKRRRALGVEESH